MGIEALVPRARALAGEPLVWTAGGVMLLQAKRVVDGWFFASQTHLVFFADTTLPSFVPGIVDQSTALWRLAELAQPKVTAPFFTPNGIIDFGLPGIELVGAKSRMKAIAALARTQSNFDAGTS